MKMKSIIILILAIVCSVIANCSKEFIYICKENDKKRQDLSHTCRKLNDATKYNCTCFGDVHYLDCLDALRKGKKESGVYSLKPDNLSPFKAYCDMWTDGGGWTVFQKRMRGSVDFCRNWTDYVHGFGNLSGEHWLGLSKIHRLANGSVSTQLQVEISDDGSSIWYKYIHSAYARYSTFYIGDSTTDYTLHLYGYSGTAGDHFSKYNGERFCTKDKIECTNNTCCHGWWCNKCRSGLWGYVSCCHCNLNGPYTYPVTCNKWCKNHLVDGPCYLPRYIEMKLRRT